MKTKNQLNDKKPGHWSWRYLASCIPGMTLFFSGLSKTANFQDFVQTAGQLMHGAPHALVYASLLVPGFELTFGCFFLFMSCLVETAVLSILLFIAFIGIHILSPHLPTCGCFQIDALDNVGEATFYIRDSGLILSSLFVIYLHRKRKPVKATNSAAVTLTQSLP
jgi:hypothetical protein